MILVIIVAFFPQVTPRYPGNFIISVYDICLDAEGPATAQVTFADVYGIEVSVADKVPSLHSKRIFCLHFQEFYITYIDFN